MAHNSFGLEQLEGRRLFSVPVLVDMPPLREPSIAADAVSAPTHPLAGAFNVAGTYEHPIMPGNPDGGSHYNFNGKGRKASLGKFHLTGEVTAPGFIQSARSRGQLVISNGHGTITMSVVGPLQGPGVLPGSMNYRVRSGTGAYATATGRGKLLISASSSTMKFLFRFNPTTA